VARREIERAARGQQVTIKDACHSVLEAAYRAVSDNGSLPANARQIMYDARRRVLAMGLTWYKNDATFTQRILPDFIAERGLDWNVVYDARGNLRGPYGSLPVRLGTLEVRDHMAGWKVDRGGLEPIAETRVQFDATDPALHYSAVLFLEKEGFDPLIDAAGIRDRYGIATMSTKGLPVTAARELVDRFTAKGIPVLVLRDFDVAGFNIAKTLTTSNRRHTFDGTPLVHDLGLRLDDALAMGLDDEPVVIKQDKSPADNLTDAGATDDEIEFLIGKRTGRGWDGRRIELNAMTSRQFLHFLERKLQKHGVSPVVPDADLLAHA
jgi:hypothetical protein